MTLKEIIMRLQNSSKSIEELGLFPKGNRHYKIEIQNLLKEALINRDESLIEYLLLIANYDGFDSSYTGILCNLLNESWEYIYEDIILYLREIKDPNSINCIYNASLLELDYDDGKSLAKKCIWALGAINTSFAFEKIEALSRSKNAIIKEAALMELKRRVK